MRINFILLFIFITLQQYYATRLRAHNRLKTQALIKLRVREKLGLHVRSMFKNQLRNNLQEFLEAKDQAQKYSEIPPGPLGKRLKDLMKSNPKFALEMSPSNAQNMRSSDWEFWENLATMPKYWFGDICDLKREAETITLQCSDLDELGETCYSGEILNIYTGFYGFVQGECPSFYHTWKCVKEVQGVLDDDEQGRYKCKEQPSCSFPVDPNEYKLVPWSTWIVNGEFSPHLNHHPNMNDCEKHQEQKLAVVATCKCVNPIDQQETEPPPMNDEFADQAAGGSGANGPMASDSRSMW